MPLVIWYLFSSFNSHINNNILKMLNYTNVQVIQVPYTGSKPKNSESGCTWSKKESKTS